MKHVFISAELSTLSRETNQIRTDSLSNILDGMTLAGFLVERVNGVYQGSSEVSFRVTCPESELFDVGFFRNLARNLGQESILWVKEDGNSFLDFIQSGDMLHLGKMKRIKSARGLMNYSVINGQVYSVSK